MVVDRFTQQRTKGTCWKCGKQAHFARECPKLNLCAMSLEDIEAMMEQRQLDELKELQNKSVRIMNETKLLDKSFVDLDFSLCTK